ncbi:AraC family transcriptional regulator [Paenibacillus sp. ACRRY]|uniref:AraC family transcriptional regulator n=1 Tax=Paenibacillus sp. ACRRY TaxID=2918208 RepID=UPI001EF3E35E|nr:AraC family transcriptional regulator [Paenibacillus sp. ACRRY]MCG7383122.1 AraC family transcriptional regulator [Paenibacillus sp. ACRRY]
MLKEDHLLLWDYANIQLKDIRHHFLGVGDGLTAYRFPSSGYLYITRGTASFRLNGKEHEADRFHVIHSGKGGLLDIYSVREGLEYYLVFYKASLSIRALPGVRRRFETCSPFHKPYDFVPHDPVGLLLLLKEMRRMWLEASVLERIQVKSKLYQFVYEIEKQLQMNVKTNGKPDLAEQAIYYIREYYREPITLSSVAERFNYSAAYMAKQFKTKTGSSLIDYVIQTRIEKAQELLLHTEASLQEIAEGVGYKDLSYFIRMFKKVTGLTPGNYRSISLQAGSADRPITRLRLSNAQTRGQGYIGDEYDNHYQYRRGDLPMCRNTKRSMGAVMLLCLAILVSACSPAVSNTSTTSASSVETQTSQQVSTAPSERLYTDNQGHEVSIPEKPQRIVLQGNSIGDLLALGVQPVGIDRRFIENSAYEDKEITPAEDIGFPTSFEKILSLEPDLTMLGYVLDKQYDEISKISPTVVFDQNLPLNERLTVIGEIVGKQDEAKQLLTDYNLKAEKMWSELRKQGKIEEGETAVVMLYYWDRTMYLMKTGGVPELLYQPQGYKMSDKVKGIEPAEGSPFIEISPELMHETLIGDHLFVLYPQNDDAEASFKELLETPLWKKLPAVQSGKVTFIESKWNYEDMLTSDMLLDEFPKMIAE